MLNPIKAIKTIFLRYFLTSQSTGSRRTHLTRAAPSLKEEFVKQLLSIQWIFPMETPKTSKIRDHLRKVAGGISVITDRSSLSGLELEGNDLKASRSNGPL